MTRAEKERQWKKGNLRWKLKPVQRRIDDVFEAGYHKLFVGECSRRIGKTYWAVLKCFEFALSKPNSNIVYASAFVQHLEKFTVPAAQLIMEDIPGDIKPKWIEGKKTYRFKNGSILNLVGLDKYPDGMRGNFIDLAVFEEAGQISRLKYLYSSVVYPATMKRFGSRIIMISTPSSEPEHEFIIFCDRAQQFGSYIIMTIDDDTELDSPTKLEYLEECLDDETRQREYFCKRIVDQNRRIVPEWQDSYEVEIYRPVEFPYLHRYVFMDIGVTDLTAVLFGYYHFQRQALVIEDEITINGPQMTTDILQRLIKEKEAQLWPKMKTRQRISDNNNLLLLQDLSSMHGIPFLATSKDSLEAMVNEMRIFIKNGRLFVSPKCRLTLGGLKFGMWDKWRKKFDRSINFGHFDHLAALMYGIRNIDQHTNPIPHLWDQNISKETHYIPPTNLYGGSDISNSGKLFKKFFSTICGK